MTQPTEAARPATTTDSVRATLDKIDAHDIRLPAIEITWHRDTDESAIAILTAFPEVAWQAMTGGSSEWLSGQFGKIKLNIFIEPDRPVPASRAEALLAEARASL